MMNGYELCVHSDSDIIICSCCTKFINDALVNKVIRLKI